MRVSRESTGMSPIKTYHSRGEMSEYQFGFAAWVIDEKVPYATLYIPLEDAFRNLSPAFLPLGFSGGMGLVSLIYKYPIIHPILPQATHHDCQRRYTELATSYSRQTQGDCPRRHRRQVGGKSMV